VRLPLRTFPNEDEAERALRAARQRLAELQRSAAPRGAIRTAQCDLFGAEEALTLAGRGTRIRCQRRRNVHAGRDSGHPNRSVDLRRLAR
jgi:hypothetical protein